MTGYAKILLFPIFMFLAALPANAQERVDLNLVLAVDSSYSVDAREYALQMAGMASAFIDPTIIDAIESGTHGAIAVTVVQWSHEYSQIVVVPWTKVASGQDALNLAAAIARTQRQTSEGATSISGLLNFAQGLLRNAPYQASRNVIDVVADGENNNGERIERVRDRVIAQGTTINGLAIQNEVIYLQHYMRNRVIGGGFSFVEQAIDYTDFGRAIYRKLLREIQGVPIG